MRPLSQQPVSMAKPFWLGFLCGALLLCLLLTGAVLYLLRHPDAVYHKALTLGADRIFTGAVKSLPKEYVAANREKIMLRIDRLMEAFSQERIAETDIRQIGSTLLGMMADRDLTPGEMDALLTRIDEICGDGS